MSLKVEVWDWPLRLFHWLLVAAVLAAFVSGELGGNWMDWHGRIGILVLGLLVFRAIWGFAGSTHARFSSFFPTPSKLADYLKGRWQGAGHSPLGALAVIALLTLVGAQVATGLFANDDIAFQGPLSGLVDKDLSDRLSGWHELLFDLLAGLVVLHIAAIVFYLRVKKTDLVRPMLTGRKIVSLHESIQITGGGGLRFIAAVVIAGAVVCGVLELAKPPAEPVTQSAPPATPGW